MTCNKKCSDKVVRFCQYCGKKLVKAELKPRTELSETKIPESNGKSKTTI